MPNRRLLLSLAPGTLAVAGFATLLAFGLTACKSNAPAPIVNNNAADNGGPDPADANMASSGNGQPTQVMGQSQSYSPQQQGQYYQQSQAYPQGQTYPQGEQAPAPIVQGYSDQSSYDQGYADGEAVEANTAPPPLPEYDQPPAPDPNDLWTPGYWDYGTGGYYWVPGTWVAAPYYGALWTPPWWGWYGGHYRFHRGYWGPHIGYYGGINYGFGYIGVGYYGGYWRGHDFFYNRAVNNVSVVNVRNVYERTVVVNNIHYGMQPTVRTSFNGGPGGINAQPRPFEVAAEHERHESALPAQVAMRQQAVNNRGNFFAANQGRPAQVAVVHPPNAPAALPANGVGMNRPGEAGRPGEANRPGEPAGPMNHPGAPNAGAFNRPGEPAGTSHPGAPANQPFNRPGEPAGTMNHSVAPNAAVNHPGAPANNPGRPAEPANHPGNFDNRPAVNRPTPEANHTAPAPNVNRPAPTPNVNRPAPTPNVNRPEPSPAIHRPAPAAPHVETVRPDVTPHVQQAPAPHVEAPRPAPAPAPHVEAPHPAPAPAPHAAPAGGGHPGGGEPHGPR